ncbi:MAG: hypothetical protein HUJ72_00285 [Blautia sp.]|nr:hypothetical protein [Blautia sp.]
MEKFGFSLFGYAKNDVEEYVDIVERHMEEMQSTNDAANAKYQKLEAKVKKWVAEKNKEISTLREENQKLQQEGPQKYEDECRVIREAKESAENALVTAEKACEQAKGDNAVLRQKLAETEEQLKLVRDTQTRGQSAPRSILEMELLNSKREVERLKKELAEKQQIIDVDCVVNDPVMSRSFDEEKQKLMQEKEELQKQLTDKDLELKNLREENEWLKKSHDAVSTVLVNARINADNMVSDAEKKANKIVEDAQQDALRHKEEVETAMQKKMVEEITVLSSAKQIIDSFVEEINMKQKQLFSVCYQLDEIGMSMPGGYDAITGEDISLISSDEND